MDDTRLDRTVDLVARVKSGDRDALERLCARVLPDLQRWASGRLPRSTRDLMDTDDVVQDTVVRAVNRIGAFESRHEGALQAYLRQAVVDRIRNEMRRAAGSPDAIDVHDTRSDPAASPLEQAIGRDAIERYEAALGRLNAEEREAIVARLEMEWSYQDIAQALGQPSADTARMTVSRALLRLAKEMTRGHA